MLRKFSVRNYKNFKDTLELDLSAVGGYRFNQECITNNNIGKCIIYGRNATGKTNLGEALIDIAYIVVGRPLIHKQEKIIHANSKDSVAEFSYSFLFDSVTLDYEYTINERKELLSEKLLVDSVTIFDMDFKKLCFTEINLEAVSAETIQIDKYLSSNRQLSGNIRDENNSQVPFLRYILNNAPLMESSVLIKLEKYARRMRINSVGGSIITRNTAYNRSFTDYLAESDNLLLFQNFLNEMGIDCSLVVKEAPDGQSELFFKYDSLIPFYDNASSGTIALTSLYKRMLTVDREPALFYMDEFDAFYNYEMSEKLLNYFKKNLPLCQIILTTHNTNLMTNQLMRPDCLFILSRSGKLTALCDATERELREGHNLEKLYIGGEFEKYE